METRSSGLAIGWAAAWIALALLTAVIIGPWLRCYAAMGVELPLLTIFAVNAGEALRGPVGWFALAPLLALGLLPLHLGVGGDDHRRWLKLGIAQAVVAALLLWAFLELPLMTFSKMLSEDDVHLSPPLDLHGVVAPSALFTAPILLVLTFLQVAAWIPISVRVFSLPRVRLHDEALRAIVLAILPGLALAIGAALLVDELRLTPWTGLVVSPALAAAGTALLVVYGGALWLRLRLPAA